MLIYKIIQSLKPTFILTTQVTLNIRELGKIWGLEPRFALSKHVTHIYQYHQIEILDTENIRKVWREPYVKFSKIFLLDTKNIMKFWWEPYLKFSEIFFLVTENIKKVWREPYVKFLGIFFLDTENTKKVWKEPYVKFSGILLLETCTEFVSSIGINLEEFVSSIGINIKKSDVFGRKRLCYDCYWFSLRTIKASQRFSSGVWDILRTKNKHPRFFPLTH